MLTLGYFSKWPSLYKDREKFIKFVRFTSVNSTINENQTITIRSSTDKYSQEIIILDEDIHHHSNCKVFCTCESFKFEFANSIAKQNSLLRPINFMKSIEQKPKQKNKYNTPSGCKHIIALVRYIPKLRLKNKKRITNYYE